MQLFFLNTAKPIDYFDERLKAEALLGGYVNFTKKTQFSLYDPSVRPKELEFIMIESIGAMFRKS
jgi:hypothetical protein